MRKASYTAVVIVVLFLSAFAALPPTYWKVAEGYAIEFTSDDASGVFTKFKASLAFDADQLEASSFRTSVDVSSISTGNGTKNNHAKSDEWLDAETYPQITFVSARFAKKENGFEVTGTLELHGLKKEISIPFTFENNTFDGHFSVNRLDYNIGKATGMSGKVSKELQIHFSVPVTK